MARNILQWIGKNLGTFLMAFVMAIIVWISAVVTADPNEIRTFRATTIDMVGLDPNLLLIGEMPNQARLTLEAPTSIWNRLNNTPSLVRAWVDLSGLGPGEHTVAVKTRIDISPVRSIQVDPENLTFTLENLAKRDFPVEITVEGELPLGYQMGTPELEPLEVVVSGPESAVLRVAQVRAALDIGGALETFHRNVTVQAVDQNGDAVENVTLTPKSIRVTQPISLLGGFKTVVVKVVTSGQVANGYRLTNISVSPPTVTLFSNNPQLVDEIPGFVETLPVDLSGLSDDLEINAALSLPAEVTSVLEPVVLVQVGVAAIEGSLTLSLPVQIAGLTPDLQAKLSPETVDVILAGPLNVLESLDPASVQVVLDLSGLPPGIYQRPLNIYLPTEAVRVQTTLPETVEVNLSLAPTPTVSPSPELTPAPTGQATPAGTPQP